MQVGGQELLGEKLTIRETRGLGRKRKKDVVSNFERGGTG